MNRRILMWMTRLLIGRHIPRFEWSCIGKRFLGILFPEKTVPKATEPQRDYSLFIEEKLEDLLFPLKNFLDFSEPFKKTRSRAFEKYMKGVHF